MKHNVVRSVLTLLLVTAAVFGFVDGGPTIVKLCQGAPFTGTTVPLVLLPMVVLVISLLAAATVFIRHAWSVFLAAVVGFIMIACVVTELAMGQQISWPQSIIIAIGLVVIALAAYLWTTEFRGHHLPSRHISHA
jgi:hypothetical protein